MKHTGSQITKANRTYFKGFVLVCSLLIMTQIKAVNYFVSPDGKSKNSGLSVEKALNSLQDAEAKVKPGDTVFVCNGTYTNIPGKNAVLEIRRSGEANKWIVFTNYPGHKPKLKFNCWEAICFIGVAYIEVSGFEIEGNVTGVTLEYAKSQMNNLANPLTCGNGITIRQDTSTKKGSHHILVRNNIIYNCSGGGIGAINSDYISIKNNIVYQCAYYAPYANSGISIYQALDIDTFTGTKIIITGNVSHSNYNYIPFYFSNVNDPEKREFTDGNGIIIDDLVGSQKFVAHSSGKSYGGRTLIANNLVYNNGGSGIHAFKSCNVDIVNNTAFQNGRHEKMDPGQIFAIASENVNIINNILYALPGKKINNEWENKNVTYSNNLYYDGTEKPVIVAVGRNIIIADPQFENPSLSNSDFHLKAGSPCIKWGKKMVGVDSDFDNKHRNHAANVDLGAFEFFEK